MILYNLTKACLTLLTMGCWVFSMAGLGINNGMFCVR